MVSISAGVLSVRIRRILGKRIARPLLWRALNLEFRGALPNRIAKVDARSDGFHKVMLETAGLMFCSHINGSRSDELRLYNIRVMPDIIP